MKKGIIMEVNKRFLMVLTPEGEFLRARKENSPYQIGQEIMFTPVAQEKRVSFFPIFRGRILWPAAATFLLLFLFIIPFYQNNQVYAYLSIDLNPSIELGVNRKGQVIELKSYNNDGEKVLHQIQDWKHKDADDVVSSIIDEIKKQGYMKDKQKMVVAAVYAEEDAKVQDSWKEEMEEIQEVISAEKLDLTIVEGTVSEREKAIEEGLTLGLYKEKKLKELKEHKAKAEAKKKLKENNAKAEEKLKENNEEAEMNKKSVPAKEESKPVENPLQTEAKKQKEQTKAVEENKTKIPPGQSKKEEKPQGNTEIPADVKQENAAAIPVNGETSNNLAQKVQEPKVKENNGNNNTQNVNKNENKGNETNGNNGNNGIANEKKNYEDSSNGQKANQHVPIDNSENMNEIEQ